MKGVVHLQVAFHELGSIEDRRLAFAVIGARFEGQWVFVKHRRRQTWEIPGGHREAGETIGQTASRELSEETGAEEFDLIAICEYSVIRGEDSSYGRLFLATIRKLGPLPDHEIGRIELFADLPQQLTYPDIQPKLQLRLEQVIDRSCSNAY